MLNVKKVFFYNQTHVG